MNRRTQKVRTLLTVSAIFVTGISIAATPPADRDQALAEEYVLASVVSEQAETACSGMHPDRAMLHVLRVDAGVTDDDEIWLEGETAIVLRAVLNDVDHLGGPVWCTTAWVVYGPRGLHTIKPSEE